MLAVEGQKTVKGAWTRVASATTVIHDWSLPEGRSPDNLRDVKMCNPLKVITPAALREKYEDPSIQAAPAHWRRFSCNQSAFLEGEEPPITPEEWDAARVDIGAMVDGEKVHAVVRVGQAGGCSIGIAAARDEGVAVRLEVYPYSFPGLKKALHRLVDRYQVEKIYIDPRQHGLGTDVLEATGLPLADWPQTPVSFMETTATFLGLLSDGKVSHDGDEVLRGQAILGRMRESVTGAYFEPSAETQGLIAVVMAVHAAAERKPVPKIHVWKGA
jgi:hypothetical protein